MLCIPKVDREPRPAHLSRALADFVVLPCSGEAGHGIHRSSFEVRRLRRRICVYRGRAGLFLRQTIQERPQALQAMQGQAGARYSAGAAGDADHVLGVRHGDHGSFQTHPGPAGAVPHLLPEAGPGAAFRVSQLNPNSRESSCPRKPDSGACAGLRLHCGSLTARWPMSRRK
jgi:hypothetical protein